MKNSTILVVGTLGLIGAYLYLKRKQAPIINEIVDNSLGLSTSSTSPTTTTTSPTTTTTSPITTTTSPTTTTTSPITATTATTVTNATTTTTNTTSVKPYVADVSLGLSPKPIIESETENYIKSKALSKGVQVLFQQMQNLQNELRNTVPSGLLGMFKKPDGTVNNREVIIAQINSVGKQMSENTAQAIALGYKILPLGEIEKLQII